MTTNGQIPLTSSAAAAATVGNNSASGTALSVPPSPKGSKLPLAGLAGVSLVEMHPSAPSAAQVQLQQHSNSPAMLPPLTMTPRASSNSHSNNSNPNNNNNANANANNING